MVDQTVQDFTNCAGFNSDCVRVTHLPENLRFANHHRIEGRRDAENMPHSFFVGMAIKVRLEKTRRQMTGGIEKMSYAPGAKFELVFGCGAEDLDAIAG